MDFLHGIEGPAATEEEERSQRMFKRIEELEDLLIEMKQKSGVAKIVELETQLTQSNIEIGKKTQMVDELSAKLRDQESKQIIFLPATDQVKVLQDRAGPSLGEKERDQLKQLIDKPSEILEDDGKKVKFSDLTQERELRNTAQDNRSKWFVDEDSGIY